MKVGLVLEGGAMRGMFTAGVLDIFLDHHIQIDGVVSVSAGALFGVNLLSKQRGRALRYNLQFLNDTRYISLKNWFSEGNIVSKNFAFYEVPFQHDIFDNQTFKHANIPFYATLTNVETGQAEYHLIEDVFAQMETLRATSALPYFSKMVEVNGQYYLDGAESDSIPVDFCQTLGFDKLIVILTRPAGYRKTPSFKWLSQWVYRDYPNLVETMQNRYQKYNDTLDKIEQQHQTGEIFMIRPSQNLAIKRLENDPQKIQAMYDLGVQDAMSQLDSLLHYLAQES